MASLEELFISIAQRIKCGGLIEQRFPQSSYMTIMEFEGGTRAVLDEVMEICKKYADELHIIGGASNIKRFESGFSFKREPRAPIYKSHSVTVQSAGLLMLRHADYSDMHKAQTLKDFYPFPRVLVPLVDNKAQEQLDLRYSDNCWNRSMAFSEIVYTEVKLEILVYTEVDTWTYADAWYNLLVFFEALEDYLIVYCDLYASFYEEAMYFNSKLVLGLAPEKLQVLRQFGWTDSKEWVPPETLAKLLGVIKSIIKGLCNSGWISRDAYELYQQEVFVSAKQADTQTLKSAQSVHTRYKLKRT